MDIGWHQNLYLTKWVLVRSQRSLRFEILGPRGVILFNNTAWFCNESYSRFGVNLNGSIVGVITGDYSIQTFVRKSYKFKGMESWWIGIITICIHCLGILTIYSRSTGGWLILRLRFTKVWAFFMVFENKMNSVL